MDEPAIAQSDADAKSGQHQPNLTDILMIRNLKTTKGGISYEIIFEEPSAKDDAPSAETPPCNWNIFAVLSTFFTRGRRLLNEYLSG